MLFVYSYFGYNILTLISYSKQPEIILTQPTTLISYDLPNKYQP